MSADPGVGSLRLAGGGRLRVVTPRLAAGGEGVIYALDEPAGLVLKHYKAEVLARKGVMLAAKVESMLAHPPENPTAGRGHCSLAWPRSAVVDGRGVFAGYVMPAIDGASSAELHMVANPADRNRSPKVPTWLRGFSWKYLLRVALNLAAATQALHDAGYVIGDFNERNVLVSSNALVSLVDCDSMQVPDPAGLPFLCSVMRPEFTAPELLGADLSRQPRTAESDRFPLAVHIYQLLMEGRHPFAGVWHGRGDKPRQFELAQQGLFVQAGDRRLTPQAGTPPFGVFPADVQQLFTRAFVAGAASPAARPGGLEWHRHLDRLDRALVTCRADPAHLYPGHLAACPWCALGAGPRVATAPRPKQAPLPPAAVPPRTAPPSWPPSAPPGAGYPAPHPPPRPAPPTWPPPPAQPWPPPIRAKPNSLRIIQRFWPLLLTVWGIGLIVGYDLLKKGTSYQTPNTIFAVILLLVSLVLLRWTMRRR